VKLAVAGRNRVRPAGALLRAAGAGRKTGAANR
jgi:hypothetical protein